MSHTPSREPGGTDIGGRFATQPRPEPHVQLHAGDERAGAVHHARVVELIEDLDYDQVAELYPELARTDEDLQDTLTEAARDTTVVEAAIATYRDEDERQPVGADEVGAVFASHLHQASIDARTARAATLARPTVSPGYEDAYEPDDLKLVALRRHTQR